MRKKVNKKMHFAFQLMAHLVQLMVQSRVLNILKDEYS